MPVLFKRIIVCFAVVCLTLGAAGLSEGLDYSDAENWAFFGEGEDKPADLFIICPTVDMGRDGNMNMPLDSEKMRSRFIGALNLQRGIYEQSLSMYAPYYRQATFPVFFMDAEEAAPYEEIAYQDVREAFAHFLALSDRPFVLAGFSQGAEIMMRLLKEFFADPAYQDRLIAAYCIGWRFTEADAAEAPWLKPAQTADDTGVIICINTEAVGVTESELVPKDVKTYAINPLNWRTDQEPAVAEENIGACFVDYDGTIKEEIPGFTGAYVDPVRGTIKVPDVDIETYSSELFQPGVFHLNDYLFFYRNLQQNVALRIETYMSEH